MGVAVVKEEVDHGKHDARSAALSDNVSERSLQLHRVVGNQRETGGYATRAASERRSRCGYTAGGRIFRERDRGQRKTRGFGRRSRYMGTVKSDMRVRIRVKTMWMSLKITLKLKK